MEELIFLDRAAGVYFSNTGTRTMVQGSNYFHDDDRTTSTTAKWITHTHTVQYDETEQKDENKDEEEQWGVRKRRLSWSRRQVYDGDVHDEGDDDGADSNQAHDDGCRRGGCC